MKKIFLIGFTLVTISVMAQNMTDVLKYSVNDMNGTARYKSMSGAFGSLGGDFSALGVNPAGSAIFSTSEIGFSLGYTTQNNKNNYFSTLSHNKTSDFSVSQVGAVLVFSDGDKNRDWKKFALAFNYQDTKNFDINSLFFNGITPYENLGDYFEYYADGISQQDLLLEEYHNKIVVGKSTLGQLYQRMENAGARAFKLRTALLGHYVGLINPKIGRDEVKVSDSDQIADAILNETDYLSNTNSLYTKQRIELRTKGGVRKYNFNFSTQYGEDFFFGINLNSHSIDYTEKIGHWEAYSNGAVSNAYFENQKNTIGSGFSFQLGAIVKATDNLRLGLTYESPTWYSLEDEYIQYVSVNDGLNYARPDIVVGYPEYKFRTPSSWGVSVAYIFEKRGILSMDYLYKGYGKTHFRTDYLRPENQIIKDQLGDVNILRIGGEFRLTNRFSLRAGYRWEQSPYKHQKFVGNLNGYSMGLGYTFNGWKLDVSYDIAKQNNQYQMYESILTTPVKVASTTNHLLFTLSSKLF